MSLRTRRLQFAIDARDDADHWCSTWLDHFGIKPSRKRAAIRRYMRLDEKVAKLGGEKTERWDMDDAD